MKISHFQLRHCYVLLECIKLMTMAHCPLKDLQVASIVTQESIRLALEFSEQQAACHVLLENIAPEWE
jgi:hypothetical protein